MVENIIEVVTSWPASWVGVVPKYRLVPSILIFISYKMPTGGLALETTFSIGKMDFNCREEFFEL